MGYQIEDVPVQSARQGAGSKYPLSDLNVGQSFVVPYAKPVKNEDGTAQTKEEAQGKQLSALRGAVQQHQSKHAEDTGTTRKNRNGVDVPATRNTRTFAVAHDVDEKGKETGKGFRLGRTA